MFMETSTLPSFKQIQEVKKKHTFLSKHTSPQIKTWLYNQQKKSNYYVSIYYYSYFKVVIFKEDMKCLTFYQELLNLYILIRIFFEGLHGFFI